MQKEVSPTGGGEKGSLCRGPRGPALYAGDPGRQDDHLLGFTAPGRVWGATPTSIFTAPAGWQKSQTLYACPACR